MSMGSIDRRTEEKNKSKDKKVKRVVKDVKDLEYINPLFKNRFVSAQSPTGP